MTTPEFSPAGYGAILERARAAGYRMLCMCEAVASARARVLLLRHDVDFSLEYAVAMADLEAQLGVRSTYFVLLYNDYYNPMSPDGRSMLRKLMELGHEVGLHWDSSVYAFEPGSMRDHFRRDLATLGELVGRPIASASQHIPADSPLLDVSTLVPNEAYSEAIRRRFAYVSDSAMKWRDTTPYDLIERSVEIQFLAHPLWWFAAGTTREEKLRNIPEDCRGRVSTRCEDFIRYMNGVLADRARYDERFRAQRGLGE
jgi:hypothetical protein